MSLVQPETFDIHPKLCEQGNKQMKITLFSHMCLCLHSLTACLGFPVEKHVILLFLINKPFLPLILTSHVDEYKSI